MNSATPNFVPSINLVVAMNPRPKSSPVKALRQKPDTKCQATTQLKVKPRCVSAKATPRPESNKDTSSLSSRTSTSLSNASVKTKGKDVKKVASCRPCSKAMSLNIKSSMYKAFGCTSDTRADNPSTMENVLDPYDEMLKKVQQSIKEKMELLKFKTVQVSTNHNSPGPDSGRDATSKNSQSQEGGKPTEELKEVMKDSKDKTEKVEEDQEEDDDDDEEGLPQAVRPVEPQGDPDTELNLLKVLHLSKMEKTAKEVKPTKMLKHFEESGYFNWNYQSHCRTTSDNQNLKNGFKKGLERLYTILTLQGPSSH